MCGCSRRWHSHREVLSRVSTCFIPPLWDDRIKISSASLPSHPFGSPPPPSHAHTLELIFKYEKHIIRLNPCQTGLDCTWPASGPNMTLTVGGALLQTELFEWNGPMLRSMVNSTSDPSAWIFGLSYRVRECVFCKKQEFESNKTCWEGNRNLVGIREKRGV